MFKQGKYAVVLAVVSCMLFTVVPVSASVVDDGNQIEDTSQSQQINWGNWWNYFFHYDVNENTYEEIENKPEAEQIEPDEQVEEKEPTTSVHAFEQEVIELTNVEREKHGLAPFIMDEKLSEVAREKSKDMRVNHYFDHQSLVHGSPFDMMKAYGVTYRTAGENIAMGQRTPSEVVQGWMNSPGHRANILNENFTHIGVGFDENGYYWTQQFIGK